jgi:TPR repeat protein
MDAARALSAFDRACEGQSGEGCYKAGLIHAGANRPIETLERARKACDLGYEPACAIFETTKQKPSKPKPR